MEAFRFTSRASETPPDILQGKSEMEFLRAKYQRGCIFGLDSLHSNGVYRIAGWQFSFWPIMRRYIVKQHGHWQEHYAPNASMLRRSLHGRIEEMVKLDRRGPT